MLITIHTLAFALLLPATNAFNFRLYNPYSCDHNTAPGNTWPQNGQPAAHGEYNVCYNSRDIEVRRVEFDRQMRVRTFCNSDCRSGDSYQDFSGSTCVGAPAGYDTSTSNRLISILKLIFAYFKIAVQLGLGVHLELLQFRIGWEYLNHGGDARLSYVFGLHPVFES
ncbi:hypothetical protein IFR05_012839 [Cadophora sp. M221]|nr:hypothetical protein IFR05_012839 [Cadophora sp. M221]